MTDKENNIGKIERCGFCGMWFCGNEYLTLDDLKNGDHEEINNAPLGYCPNAQSEYETMQTQLRRITKDMAIDAGDLSLEGRWI